MKAIRCHACQALIPALGLSAPAFEAVVQALSEGSKTLAAAEARYYAGCQAEEAQAWVAHLLACPAGWPRSAEDQQALAIVDAAFDAVEKPEHFTNYGHCDECADHDATLRGRSRDTIRREDLGSAGWDPITFASEQGMGYYFPALARLALLPDVWPGRDWYGSQLLFHLSHEGGGNRFLVWCSDAQRDAVHRLLQRLAQAQGELVASYHCGEELETALAAWAPPTL